MKLHAWVWTILIVAGILAAMAFLAETTKGTR